MALRKMTGVRRIFGLISSVLLVGMLAASCGALQVSEGRSEDGPSVKVVATNSILGDIVRNVGGEGVEVVTLVGRDGDAHTFEPEPSDNATLADADAVFENGLEFEPWLDDLYESSGSDASRVVVTAAIEPLSVAEEEHAEEGEEHAVEEEHEHGEDDPHVWHDVNNAILMVESIREALVEIDPENAENYEANAENYLSELEELDADVRARIEPIPEKNRILVTSHDTFGYFAARYDFEVDTALSSASTEASDPSAGETAKMVQRIRSTGAPAIFTENVTNPALMEAVAREAGVELAPTLYTDALGEEDGEAGTYIEMIQYNAKTISGALGG